MPGMTNDQIQAELGRLDELRAALLGKIQRMTPDQKIQQLADAQPHVMPKTPQCEALLQSGYNLTESEAKKIIKERDANPVAWPLEEYRKAQAFLAAYNATDRKPSTTREGWVRG